jgi:recombination protein RecA
MAKKKEVKEEEGKDRKVDSLDIVKKAIEKKYGKVLTSMGDQKDVIIPTISTGSLGLDAALGRAGLAFGRVYEVYGPPSGGKTTLTMSIIAQAQKQGKRCCFVDAERAADAKLFAAMGVNIDDLLLVRAFSGEENLDVLEKIMATGEIDVAVVDSVSSLIPQSEADADMEDQFMGLLARLMSKAMRKFVPLAGETNTLLIFINQVRSKIGGYGNPEVTTGGIALDFSATGRIKVDGGEAKSSHIVDPESGEVMGHLTNFVIKKNKLSKPFRSCVVPLVYGKGYDSIWECVTLATDLGILDKSGAWYAYEGKNIAQGEAKAIQFMKDNMDIYLIIREAVIKALGLEEGYKKQGLV